MNVQFLCALFQPAYTATLFVAYLTLCCRLLDQHFLSLGVAALVWLGVFAAQVLDNLGRWSPEDLVNQPDRYFILNKCGKFLNPLAIYLVIFATIAILTLVPHKMLFFKFVAIVGLIFLFYMCEVLTGWRLKKVKYLKSVFVSLGWILLALAIDFGMNREHFFIKTKGVVFILSSLVLLASDTLLLDYRDREGDRRFGIWSFPKSWDNKLTKIIFVVNVISGFLIFYLNLRNEVPDLLAQVLVVAHLTLVISTVIVPYIQQREKYLFFVSLWIPLGVIVLWTSQT